MTKADIFLRKNRVSVVGTGTTVENGIERGSFEVSVGKNKTPSIRMSAQQANVNIGGGDGISTEGDLRVNDADGKTRVQITGAADENRSGEEDRIWIRGSEGWGEIALADRDGDLVKMTASPLRQLPRSTNLDHGGIALLRHWPNLPTARGVTLEGDGRVTVGLNGRLNLNAIKNANHDETSTIFFKARSATARLGGGEQSGTIELGHSGEAEDPRDYKKTIEFDGGRGQVTVGANGTPGTVQVQEPSGSTTAEIRGEQGNIKAGGGGTQGSIALRDDSGDVVGRFKLNKNGDPVLTDGDGNTAIRMKSGGSVEFPNTSGLP